MKQDTKRNPIFRMGDEIIGFGRNLGYVGLGAVALAEENTTKMFDSLVDKGKEFGDRDDSPVEKTFRQARETVNEMSDKVQKRFKGATEPVMNRLGIPTRDQIEELIERVERLTEKVEKIKA